MTDTTIDAPLSAISHVSSEMQLSIPQLDAHRAGIELYGATKFSILSVIQPNENTLSKIIVELFNPHGSHGQGTLFLNALLSALNLKRVGGREAIRTRLEVPTPKRRRIDIVIETREYVIGIENKPWAIQQPNQLHDYLIALKEFAGNKKHVLIFLSDQEEQSAKGEVIKLPYFHSGAEPSLLGVLQASVDEIKAAKPRDFVTDLISYIDRTFGGSHEMEATDAPYINAVTAEFDKHPKAVASFLLAHYELHKRILNEVSSYIFTQIQEKFPDIEATTTESLADCLYQRYVPWGVRNSHWPINCLVGIESQGDIFNNIIYGVKSPDPARLTGENTTYASPARKHLNNLSTAVYGGRKTIYWPWYGTPWITTWEQDATARMVLQSPTGQVCDHPNVQELASKFVELVIAVEAMLS